VHYYQFNIGDYAKHTRHLSLFENMAYRLLLDRYYLKETPLDLNTKKLARLIGMTDYHDEVVQVLDDFFEKTEDGFVNSRCEKEITAYRSKADSARINGKKGGRPKKNTDQTGSEPKKTQSVSLANPTLTGSEPNPNPTLTGSKANHKPITNNQEPITKSKEGKPSSESKIPPCPHLEIIKIYHEVLPELPRVVVDLWGGQREKALRTRWKESDKHQDLDFWRWYFQLVRKNTFYLGENDRSWKADLAWLVNQTNFVKVIERLSK